MTQPATIARAFIPAGRLRAAINLGNPILAGRTPGTGAALGLSVDLARGLAERLGADVEFVVFDNAAKSVAAVKSEAADIGFFAADPLRQPDGSRHNHAWALIYRSNWPISLA